MKLQMGPSSAAVVSSAYILVGVLSSYFLVDMVKAATYNSPELVLPPTCITFDPILMKGDAEFVNTDSSSPATVPTTGKKMILLDFFVHDEVSVCRIVRRG